MKQLNLFLLIIFLFIFSSCGTIKEGFTNPKKKSTDEFLVEKKSPLIMPPEFNELPMPDQGDDIKKAKNSNIENLLKENSTNIEKEISDSDVEGSILSKIKKQ